MIQIPHLNARGGARIREFAPALKIVFVSANADPDVMCAALNAGGRDYVLKSLCGRQLIDVIKRVLRSVP